MTDYFPTKTTAEIIDVEFDFSGLLDAGESITAPVWSAIDISSNASAPEILQVGGNSSSGTVCAQRVIGGTAGKRYLIECKITTSTGRIYVERAGLGVIN